MRIWASRSRSSSHINILREDGMYQSSLPMRIIGMANVTFVSTNPHWELLI